jgi:hypothetical protein
MTASNILGVLHLATPVDYQQGMDWYRNARRICETIANKVGLQGELPAIGWMTVAGVVAALSPNNRWERNCSDAELVVRLYKAGGAEAALGAKVCTYKANLVKAVKILEGANIVETLRGPKVTEFYHCITGSVAEVCIDGHAYSIWAGQRLTMKEIPSIGKKLRAAIKADYIKAAKQFDLRPCEVQAITWCAWRRIHGV